MPLSDGILTPHAFAEEVRRIMDESDARNPEVCHQGLDALMERVLEDGGYGEGVRLIRNSNRWWG